MAPDPLPIPRYTRFYDRSATTERIYPRLTRTERAGGGRQAGGQRAGDRVYLAKAIRRRDHRERRRSEGKSREHSGVYAQTGDHLVIRGLDSFFCPTFDEREEGKVAAAATAAVTEEGEVEEDREEEREEEEEEEGFLVN